MEFSQSELNSPVKILRGIEKLYICIYCIKCFSFDSMKPNQSIQF